MRKTFKYRLQANPQTFKTADHWLELCRNLYNTALEQRIAIYRQDKCSISCFSQIKQLPELKIAFPEYQEVGSQVLQEVIERLDKAYAGFFRRVKNGDKPGFPRFKGRNRYDSFTLKKSGWRFEGKYLTIRNIGTFKLRLSRPVDGDIKTVTIRKYSSGQWYVCFSCDNVPLRPLPPTGRAVGIDVGCESFLTTSDGIKIGNPRFFKQSKDVLTMRQQMLSRRVKGSHRRDKARILLAKAYDKIYNQRRDFHFKVANRLVGYYDTIHIEKMNSWNATFGQSVQQIAENSANGKANFYFKDKLNHGLNRSMRDVAWFGFFEILRWKAEEAARVIIEVPARDTSQLCSQCGARVPKDLSVRIHYCPHCGLTIDRDVNAALNILQVGQTCQDSPAPSLRILRL